MGGLVTLISAYHYVRIFNSWTWAHRCSLQRCLPLHGLVADGADVADGDRARDEVVQRGGFAEVHHPWPCFGLDDHRGLSWRAHRGGGPLYPLELLVLCPGSFLLHRLRALGGPRRSHSLGERPKGARVDPPCSVGHRAELVDLPSRLRLPHAWFCGGFGGCAHPGGVLRLRRHLQVRCWTPHLQHH